MWASIRSYCPQCGARAEEGDRFCRRCGTRFDAPAPSAAAQEPERPASLPAPERAAPARRPRTGVFYVAAVAVVVAGLAVGLVVRGARGHDPAAAPAPPPADVGAQPSTAQPADPGLCSSRHIDPLAPHGRGGRCHTSDGTRLTVAAPGGRLRMRSMDVRLVADRTAKSVGSADGYLTSTAHGTFAIVTVAITNRLNAPASVDPAGDSQAALLLDDGKRYDESFRAQDMADENAFFARDVQLQPDETASGDFVFDLPAKGLRRFTRRGGSLVLAELGQDVGSGTRYGVLHVPHP